MTRPRRANPAAALPERDKPWLFRTYAGHSTAAKSNELYRKNLAKGQTGLSIAFDLPTQTGYDADHELARGEVGSGSSSASLYVAFAESSPRSHSLRIAASSFPVTADLMLIQPRWMAPAILPDFSGSPPID